MELVVMIIAFGVLILGSLTDLKTREVPDTLNYGLIFCGFALNITLSILHTTWDYLIASIIGAVSMFIIAAALFYSGQWGGGDAKLVIGMGALLGLSVPLLETYSVLFTAILNSSLLTFLMNSVIAGALYAIVWCMTLGFLKRDKLKVYLNNALRTTVHQRIRVLLLALTLLLIVCAWFIVEHRLAYLFLAIIIPGLYYISIITKAVEKVAMIKTTSPSKLTEGDWVTKEVTHKGKIVYKPNNIGIEQTDIKRLQRLGIKHVTIKEGIPFVPSFLLGFIATVTIGNPVQLAFQYLLG